MYDPDYIPEPEILNCMESIQIVKVAARRLKRAAAQASTAMQGFYESLAAVHAHLATASAKLDALSRIPQQN